MVGFCKFPGSEIMEIRRKAQSLVLLGSLSPLERHRSHQAGNNRVCWSLLPETGRVLFRDEQDEIDEKEVRSTSNDGGQSSR